MDLHWREMRVIKYLLVAALVTGFVQPVVPNSRVLQTQTSTSEKVYGPKDVDQKARILSRQEPQYTEQARRNHISGAVVLRVVLKASGEVGDIKVIRGLDDGLTEECIRVARLVKFEPALKNGTPVSQYVQVQYVFNAD